MAFGLTFLAIGVIITTGLLDSVVLFVLTGHVSFLDFTVPPLVMLVFWILIVPAIIAAYRIGSSGFWQAIEVTGRVHQRHINRSIRFLSNRVTNQDALVLLVTITLFQLVNETPKKPILATKLAARRRLLPSSAYN